MTVFNSRINTNSDTLRKNREEMIEHIKRKNRFIYKIFCFGIIILIITQHCAYKQVLYSFLVEFISVDRLPFMISRIANLNVKRSLKGDALGGWGVKHQI